METEDTQRDTKARADASAEQPPRRGMHISLNAQIALLVVGLIVATVVLEALLRRWVSKDEWLVTLLVLLAMVPLAVSVVARYLGPMLAMFRVLAGSVNSYQDKDYSWSLHWPRNDEIGELVDAHNVLGKVLREQRLDLVQRELLLDTMVQNTPVAMLLLQDHGAVVFSNIAARKLLGQGHKLEGRAFAQILESGSPALREAIARGGDGLFSARSSDDPDDDEDIYHLSRREFTLNGRRHELILLRHLTAELRRQEVQTWKKVIRVISHELNNSLGPIASLANSGAELVKREKYERLPDVLKTIGERTRHLEGFIEGYARFAKLPTPRVEQVEWRRFIEGMAHQVEFTVLGELPTTPVFFDVGQMEHALINLIKNAHESGSPPEQVQLAVRAQADAVRIDIMDRGSGMTDTVLANALVPFYSTKRSGTGLGLALTREIFEAHGGRISLQNREGGGLLVSCVLPV